MFLFPSFVIESTFVSFCFYSLSFLPNTYNIPVLFWSLSYMLSGQLSLAVPQYCFSITLERALLPDSGSGKDSKVPANFPLPTNVCSKVSSFLSFHHSLIVCVLFDGFYHSSILDFIYECDRNQGDFIVFIILMDTGGRGCVKDVEELVRETGPEPGGSPRMVLWLTHTVSSCPQACLILSSFLGYQEGHRTHEEKKGHLLLFIPHSVF